MSGFTDHIRWTRTRRVGSLRISRSSTRTRARYATAFHTLSQRRICAGEFPPRAAAASSDAVAAGPYPEGGSGTIFGTTWSIDTAIGSPASHLSDPAT